MDFRIPPTHEASSAAKTIQALIDAKGYASYLELGCRGNTTFNQVRCARKVGVDQNPGGTLTMSTDEYFAKHRETYDIIFVDAGHTHAQAMRDVQSALKVLNPGGAVVMHDCWPYSPGFEGKNGEASGTVWRAYVHLRTDPEVDAVCGDYDHGVAILMKRANPSPLSGLPAMDDLTYDDLERNIVSWLDLRSWDAIREWISA